MPKGTPGRTCKDCGANEHDGVTVSTRRLCIDCATSRIQASVVQQRLRHGPYRERWAAGIIAHAEKLQTTPVVPRRVRARKRSAA